MKGSQTAQRKGKKKRYKKVGGVDKALELLHYHQDHSPHLKIPGRRGDFCDTINILYRLRFIFMTEPINNLLVSKRSKKLLEPAA